MKLVGLMLILAASPFVVMCGCRSAEPKESPDTPARPERVTIDMAADGRVSIDGKAVEPSGIATTYPLPEVKKVADVVTVDASVPGCPMNTDMFLTAVNANGHASLADARRSCCHSWAKTCCMSMLCW